MASPVTYCRPQMFTVTSHPLRLQRQAVTGLMPASRQNLFRLTMGLPSVLKFDVVFTPRGYEVLTG